MPDPQQNQPQQLPPSLDQSGMSPSLGDMSRGLPPPQPAPAAFGRAVEHQQNWGMPGIGTQLGDIAYRTFGEPVENVGGAIGGLYRAAGAGEGYGPAVGEFIRSVLPFTMGGAAAPEEGATGALRMTRLPSTATGGYSTSLTPHKFDLTHIGTGKNVGKIDTIYNSDRNHLDVNYMSSSGEHLNPGFKDTGSRDPRYWAIGTAELQSLLSEVQREFPNIQTVHLTRPAWGLELDFKVERDAAGNIEGWRTVNRKRQSGGRTLTWGGPGPREQARQQAIQRIPPPPPMAPRPQDMGPQMDQAAQAGQRAAMAARAAGRSAAEANAAFSEAYRAEMARLRNPRSTMTPDQEEIRRIADEIAEIEHRENSLAARLPPGPPPYSGPRMPASQPASRELTPQETASMMEQLARTLGVR